MSWEIVARPEGKNTEGKNEGGFVILLKNGHVEEEIGRVAFERTNSLHPDVEFGPQLEIEIGKAVTAVETIRKLTDSAGELQ